MKNSSMQHRYLILSFNDSGYPRLQQADHLKEADVVAWRETKGFGEGGVYIYRKVREIEWDERMRK